jgi:hypothetical protein
LVAAAVTLLAAVWHRATVALGPVAAFPLGLVLALLAVAAWAVCARAAAGPAGLVGAAAGAFVAAQAVALRGPGGDLLIQGDLTGFAFVAGAPVLTLVAVMLPRRWFKPPPKPT